MLIQNGYGRIITRGLGGSAYCSLITMYFSVFVCTTFIPPDFSPVVGGGPFPTVKGGMFYTPASRKYGEASRLILVKVKLADHEWTKQYIVDQPKLELIVNVVGRVNKLTEKINICVDNVKRSFHIITTMFRNK